MTVLSLGNECKYRNYGEHSVTCIWFNSEAKKEFATFHIETLLPRDVK